MGMMERTTTSIGSEEESGDPSTPFPLPLQQPHTTAISSEVLQSEQLNHTEMSVPVNQGSDDRSNHLHNLLWQYQNNRSISSDTTHYVILSIYILICVVAIFANSLIVWAVIRNKKVRTPRNLLIFDLAAADLALAFTIPFSGKVILSKYWPWGSDAGEFCRIIHSLPATLVFMVSIIIIVIACDRYRCIVLRNQGTQMGGAAAIIVLPASLIVASMVSLPLYLHTSLEKEERMTALLEMTSSEKDKNTTQIVTYCMEKWSTGENAGDQNTKHRGFISILVAVLQYFVPLLLVLLIYGLIYKNVQANQYPRHLRQTKTNTLLASISLTHCLIWLPFSLFNIIVDLSPGFFGENEKYYFIFFQLFGLSSTVTNPVLYAFFNENFQREFEDGIEWTKSQFSRVLKGPEESHQSSQNSTLRVYNNDQRRNTEQVEMNYLLKKDAILAKSPTSKPRSTSVQMHGRFLMPDGNTNDSDIRKNSTSTTDLDFSTSPIINSRKQNIQEDFNGSMCNSDKKHSPISESECAVVPVNSPRKCILENPNYDSIGLKDKQLPLEKSMIVDGNEHLKGDLTSSRDDTTRNITEVTPTKNEEHPAMNKCVNADDSSVHKSQSNTQCVSSDGTKDTVADDSNQESTYSEKLLNNSLEQGHQDVTLENSYNRTFVPSNGTGEEESRNAIESHVCENDKHDQKIFPNGLSNIPPLLPPLSSASHLTNVSNI